MQKNYADLHLHTTFSDGFSTPAVVLENAHRCQLNAIAITDHDTVDGIAPSLAEGKKYGIEVIPGIELSASLKDGEIHILGYFVDHRDIVFRKKLEEVKEKRKMRLKKMVEHLADLNIRVDFDKLMKFAGPGVAGRLHLAHFLCKNKIVSHVYEAFDKYIGADKPAYEKVNAFTPGEAIELILNAGGVPVLAHPKPEGFEDLIQTLIALDLKGIEAYHPKFKEDESRYFLSMAKRYSLLVTGGSDCHGRGKLKPLIGNVKLPYEYVIELKENAAVIPV